MWLKYARLLLQIILVSPQNPETDWQEKQTDSGKGTILVLPWLLQRGAERAAGNRREGAFEQPVLGGPTLNQRKAPKPKMTSMGHAVHFLMRRETCRKKVLVKRPETRYSRKGSSVAFPLAVRPQNIE